METKKLINRYLVKVNSFTAEIDGELDGSKRTLITTEADNYSMETRDNQDGEFDIVYKFKVCGSTIVKQGDKKPILAKSKRTSSQKLRQAIWSINPDENFYEIEMAKIIANIEEVIEFLRNK